MQQRQVLIAGLFGFMAMGLFLMAAGPAQAQTTANGPYYATPSWDQTLPVATRFIVLSNFASAAVLDRETGLVWEKSPLATRHPWISTDQSSESAIAQCTNRITGGRKGWRLPSVHELASLVDPANSNPSLPTGHPFSNVQSNIYWSATTRVGLLGAAWNINFNNGNAEVFTKTGTTFVWCVRGGHNDGSEY